MRIIAGHTKDLKFPYYLACHADTEVSAMLKQNVTSSVKMVAKEVNETVINTGSIVMIQLGHDPIKQGENIRLPFGDYLVTEILETRPAKGNFPGGLTPEWCKAYIKRM
jgi:hypothetical protein